MKKIFGQSGVISKSGALATSAGSVPCDSVTLTLVSAKGLRGGAASSLGKSARVEALRPESPFGGSKRNSEVFGSSPLTPQIHALIRCAGCLVESTSVDLSAPTWNESITIYLDSIESCDYTISIELHSELSKDMSSFKFASLSEFYGKVEVPLKSVKGKKSFTLPLTGSAGEITFDIEPYIFPVDINSSSPSFQSTFISYKESHKHAAISSSHSSNSLISSSAAITQSTSHRPFQEISMPLMSCCGVCGEVIWGLQLQGVYCSDCMQFFHRRCTAFAQDTPCNIADKKRIIKKQGQFRDALDKTKKKKKFDALLASISSSSYASEEQVLEALTWLASDFEALCSPNMFQCLETKVLEASVVPIILSSLLAKDAYSKLAAVHLLKDAVVNSDSKSLLTSRGTVVGILNLLREVHTILQRSGAIEDKTYSQICSGALKVLITIDSDDTRSVFDAENGVDVVMSLSQDFKDTSDSNLMKMLGSLMIPFYDNSRWWPILTSSPSGGAWKMIMYAAQSGEVKQHRHISSSEIVFQKIIFQSPLCEVYKGLYKGHAVAIKKFDPESIAFEWASFYREICMLSICQSPSVISLFGANENSNPFIVMEFAEKGSLADVISAAKGTSKTDVGLPEDTICKYALDVATGLSFLHSHHVIHRDVKSANFVVDNEDRVKCLDFGVSRTVGKSMMTAVGTPTWMAPELLKGQVYDERADIYSFGLVLWHMATGSEPFSELDALIIMDKVLVGYRPAIPKTLNPILQSLMVRAWDGGPEKRPSAHECMKILYTFRKANTKVKVNQWERLNEQTLFHLFRMLPLATLHSLAISCSSLKVSVVNFRRAVRDLDGSKSIFLANVKVESLPYFFGAISKDIAAQTLEKCPKGTFLLRNSSLKGHFVLSGVFGKGLLHILIIPKGTGFNVDIKEDNRTFTSPAAVVEAYKNILNKPLAAPKSK